MLRAAGASARSAVRSRSEAGFVAQAIACTALPWRKQDVWTVTSHLSRGKQDSIITAKGTGSRGPLKPGHGERAPWRTVPSSPVFILAFAQQYVHRSGTAVLGLRGCGNLHDIQFAQPLVGATRRELNCSCSARVCPLP